MKRAIILTSIAVSGLVAAGVAAQNRPTIPPVGKIEKITNKLYKIGGQGGNTTVFLTKKGVVLVDTKLPNNGQAILDQVRSVTDKPITMIINTHVHPDHIGSNDFFTKANPALEVVAQDNVKKQLDANPKAIAGDKPNKTFATDMTIGSGDDEIQLKYFGAGHTNGDAFVYFPHEHTFLTGDDMAWNMGPLIDPASGGSIIALRETLTRAQDYYFTKGIQHVVTGHGGVYPFKVFRGYTSYIRALVSTSQDAVKRGQTPEMVMGQLARSPNFLIYMSDKTLPGLEYGGTPKSRTLININVAFQEIQHKKVTTNFGAPLPKEDLPKRTMPSGFGGPGGGH